jgi:hypothetical protein
VTDAARKAGANNDARPTGDTSKAPKADSTIEIASDSTVCDATGPPNHPTTFP